MSEQSDIERQELERRIIERWKKSIYGQGALSDTAMRVLAGLALAAINEPPKQPQEG